VLGRIVEPVTEPWVPSSLVLGWEVDDESRKPIFWQRADAKPGLQTIDQLVATPSTAIANHAVIIAQSGSGKSYFLGRVLEEVLIKTRCKILVLDPNADFRKVEGVKKPEHWTDSKLFQYNPPMSPGFLTDETCFEDFAKPWLKKSKSIYSARTLQLSWFDLPVEFLLDESDVVARDQLRHCHRLVQTLVRIAEFKKKTAWLQGGFLYEAERFFDATNTPDEAAVLKELVKTFDLNQHQAEVDRGVDVLDHDAGSPPSASAQGYTLRLAGLFRKRISTELPFRMQSVAALRLRVRDAAKHFYFSRASEIVRSGLINLKTAAPPLPADTRLRVIDLPSITDGRHQKLVMSTLIDSELQRARLAWERALDLPDRERDTRVPTIIVVDEAHNAIPASPESTADKKLQEQFRKIAAEGRKYGLFLMLVSQRPDKLDPM